MISRAITLTAAALGALLAVVPAHAAGDPIVHVDSFDATSLGLFGCVTDATTSYCFVATHTSDAAATNVAVLRGRFGEPARLVQANLPASALRLRPDVGGRVVELLGTIDGIGDVDVVTKARNATIRATNVGCATYPLQFALTSNSSEAIGIETNTTATVAGQAMASWTTVCDALVLAPSSGSWAFTAA